MNVIPPSRPKPVARTSYVLGGACICGVSHKGAETRSVGDRGALGGAHLQRMFPLQKVRQMYFTGEPITAAEAYRLGAVEKVVARGELRASALELAGKIAAKSPTIVRLAKEALNGVEEGDLERHYRWEQGFTAQAYLTGESQEARDAFVEKRDASGTNRTNAIRTLR